MPVLASFKALLKPKKVLQRVPFSEKSQSFLLRLSVDNVTTYAAA